MVWKLVSVARRACARDIQTKMIVRLEIWTNTEVRSVINFLQAQGTHHANSSGANTKWCNHAPQQCDTTHSLADQTMFEVVWVRSVAASHTVLTWHTQTFISLGPSNSIYLGSGLWIMILWQWQPFQGHLTTISLQRASNPLVSHWDKCLDKGGDHV
jgi:hypothetical protein